MQVGGTEITRKIKLQENGFNKPTHTSEFPVIPLQLYSQFQFKKIPKVLTWYLKVVNLAIYIGGYYLCLYGKYLNQLNIL